MSAIIDEVKNISLSKGDIVVVNNMLLLDENYRNISNESIEENTYLYFEIINDIKCYLETIGVKFIFLWLPNIRDMKKHFTYEKEVVRVIRETGSYDRPYLLNLKFIQFEIQASSGIVEAICSAYGITLCNSYFSIENRKCDYFKDYMHLSPKANIDIANDILMVLNHLGNIKNYREKSKELKHNAIKYSELTFFDFAFKSGEIEEYINYLKKIASDKPEKAGCIVMNANPFTNGHKYLVDQASKLGQIVTLG